jgi:uncharacterized membrane protein
MAKNDEFVRFHAKQAIAIGVAYMALLIATVLIDAVLSLIFFFVPVVGAVLTTLLWLAVWVGGIGLVVFLMLNAYQGKRFKLPVLGNMAENWRV